MKRWLAILACCCMLLCITALAEHSAAGKWQTADGAVVLTLQEDGSWFMDQGGQRISGTWTEAESVLHLTSGQGATLQAEVRGDRLVMGGVSFERAPVITPTPMPTQTPPPTSSDDFSWYTMGDQTEIVITECRSHAAHLVIPEEIDGMTVVGISSYVTSDAPETISIPATVRMIDPDAFGNAYMLEEIIIDEKNPWFSCRDLVIYDKAGTTLLMFPVGAYYGAYTVETGVTTIAGGAFTGGTTVLTLPDTVTTLEAGFITLDAQRGMREMHIPASVTSIGDTDLQGVTLWLERGSYAQQWADAHGYFWVAEGETAEQDGLLLDQAGTTVLRVLSSPCTVPDTVTRLGANAYAGRIWDGTIPAGITRIEAFAFSNTQPLSWEDDGKADVVVPDTVEYIGYGAFQSSGSLRSLTLPQGMTTLPPYLLAFAYGVEEVVLPPTVTEIGYMAFFSCSRLRSIVLPDGLTTIGGQAFDYCEALERLYIPPSVTELNHNFGNCPQLTLQLVEGSYAHAWARENQVPYELVPER